MKEVTVEIQVKMEFIGDLGAERWKIELNKPGVKRGRISRAEILPYVQLNANKDDLTHLSRVISNSTS